MFKKNPLSAAEADLAALVKRGAGLAQRRDAAVAALAAATVARHNLLTETEDPSAADLSKVDRAVRDARDARDAAVDAVAAVEGRASEVRATVEALKAEAERECHAAAIEASAAEADRAIARLVKAAGELDSARRDLAAALLPEAVPCYAPPERVASFGPSYLGTTLRYDARGNPMRDTLDVEQVAARIVGHLVSAALPSLGIARLEDVTTLGLGGLSTPILAPVDAGVARSLLTDPMRASAARAREGIAEPTPLGTRPPRRQADGWTVQPDGRCHDKAGVPVTPGGFYLEDGEAEQFQPHPLMPAAVRRPTDAGAAT